MLFFYQIREPHIIRMMKAAEIKKKLFNQYITGGNKMAGIIAVVGIVAVSGVLTYEFEEKIAPREK
jgi:hypothetical protein